MDCGGVRAGSPDNLTTLCIFAPMKRLVSIGLLLLLVFQVAGYFSVFRLIQSGIRKEVFRDMESGIEPRTLIEIVVPNDRAQAALKGYTLIRNREIIFKGVYYDIVRGEPFGTDMRYFCYADSKETRLAEQMNEKGDRDQQEQAGLVHHIISLALAAYLADYVQVPDNPGRDQLTNKTGYFFSVVTWEPAMIVPPPRVIV